MKKKFIITSLPLIVAFLFFVPTKSEAMTANQGANWAENRIGWSIDYDGMYGVQCKDFVNQFISENFGGPSIVNNYFRGNAIVLSYCQLPPGWTRIKNTSSFVPRRGDIAVWAYGSFSTYGHTGIITSANVNNFYSVDQNWNRPQATSIYHNYNGFWGVVRPPYN